MWLDRRTARTAFRPYEIARALKVRLQTDRVVHGCTASRYAMHHGTINKMSGTVEADETFIGGKARNMHHGQTSQKR